MNSKFSGCRYVLAVKSLEKSADYYKNKLGFQTKWEGHGWHFLFRENIKIMLGECPDEKPAFDLGNHSYFAYLEVENIDELYQDYQSKQVEINSPIENKPWGQREFSIRTIDGHRINFGEEFSSEIFKKFMED